MDTFNLVTERQCK